MKVLPFLIASCCCMVASTVAQDPYPLLNGGDLTEQMPQRDQWDPNFGYCGETSFIQGAFVFGIYVSQYDLRAMISPDQKSESSQLLISDTGDASRNDLEAAKLMGLGIEWYDAIQEGADPVPWLTWMAEKTGKGYPVTSVVLKKDGQMPTYDHIVSVIRVTGSSMTDFTVRWDDHYGGMYTWKAADHLLTRAEVNALAGGDDTWGFAKDFNKYAVALTGPTDYDADKRCAVWISVTPNKEVNEIKEGSNDRPTPNEQDITVHGFGVTAGKTYYIAKYDSFAAGAKPVSVDAVTVAAGASKFERKYEKQSSDKTAIFKCFVTDPTSADGDDPTDAPTTDAPTTDAPTTDAATTEEGDDSDSSAAHAHTVATIVYALVSAALFVL